MITVADLRPLAFFDGLADAQLAQLVDVGAEVRVDPGLELFHEGEHADFWWVLVDGAVELVRRVGPEDVVVGRMDVPGRWAGGFRAWDEHGVYLATARGVSGGRLLRVPAAELRRLSDDWFPFGGRLIEGLYRTARTIEATARQRESLLTLGTLAAGLAHEINNPAAASARAVDALREAHAAQREALARLVATGRAADVTVLDALRQELATPAGAVDPLALADLEDELTGWLDDHGVEGGWLLAPVLAAAGADAAWCGRVARALPEPALEAGLAWVTGALTVEALLRDLRESTRRVSELVGAVQSYSQVDRASRQSVDLTEGLESALVMLGHKVGAGIAVVRDHAPDVPRVDVYPGELNQVWTNLIDNALDAMAGTGTLRLASRLDGDGVVVEVGDTGPGFAAEVAARAFDAFFTTKDVGKGTGLGLDIARRIVEERHGGTLTIDSRPGQTVLRVRLPLRPTS